MKKSREFKKNNEFIDFTFLANFISNKNKFLIFNDLNFMKLLKLVT